MTAAMLTGATGQTAAASTGRTFRRRGAVCVAGGGVGGVAAVLAAASRGRSVLWAIHGDMIGGQFTEQLVPPDEHYWIEEHAGGHGSSATYRELRERVRESYRRWRPMTEAFKTSREADPGNSWVSRLTAEPGVWERRMYDMLRPYLKRGRVKIIENASPLGAAVITRGGQRHINKVGFRHPNGNRTLIQARMFIDATETGDLLPAVGADHTIGRESNMASGRREMHNHSETADPHDQQSFTWVAAVGYDPDAAPQLIDRPPGYAAHRPSFDQFFAEHLFDPTRDWHWWEARDAGYDHGNFWQYRRVVAQSEFAVPVEEVTLLNYACNDYKGGPLIDPETNTVNADHLAAAKNLTACLVHYLQNDIPRRDGGGTGYPGLRLRPDIAGTNDGYARRPYVRESRRIISIGRVWEWHVGVDARPDSNKAHQFGDTVGTGHYWLDIHAGPKSGGLWRACYPYQVPLMALIPRNVDNLLAGGKCLGVSHVVNGAYRLHPTEWVVGEAAGIVAHCALYWGETPKRIRNSTRRLATLQDRLTKWRGTHLTWPAHLQTKWEPFSEFTQEVR